MAVLPAAIGTRTTYEHSEVRYFITPTSARSWVVGRDGSGETVAILTEERVVSGRWFRLRGPLKSFCGESWMLLLARL